MVEVVLAVVTAGCVLTLVLRCTTQTPSTRMKKRDPFYSGRPWRRLRAAFLAQASNALCATCKQHGRTTAATVVDHKVPRQEHPEGSYDWDNLRPLCWACHTRKTQGDHDIGLTPRVASR